MTTGMATTQPSQNEQHSSLESYFRPDAQLFFRNINKYLEFWFNLALDTHVEDNMSTAVAMTALRTIDDIISSDNAEYWQHRLAYLQLHRTLKTLEHIIERQRRRNQFDRHRGHGNSTILFQAYTTALHGKEGVDVRQRKRLALRWSLLVGRSLCLAVTYADCVGYRMYVYNIQPMSF